MAPGQDYYLVDDHVTQGGTLADLKGYIESRGGNVIGATTLSGSNASDILAPTPGWLDAVRQKFPGIDAAYQERFGHDASGLTNSEARGLHSKFGSLDDIRARVLARTLPGDRGAGAGIAGPGEDETGGEFGDEFAGEPGSGPAAAGGAEGVNKQTRAFDLAGDPGSNLKLTDELRQRAAKYISTDSDAASPIEVHLDQLAADPVAAVNDIANNRPP